MPGRPRTSISGVAGTELNVNVKAPKPPPTQAQLERIDSMIDHPAFDDKLETLTKRMDSMLKTKGQAGILIGWMKGQIKAYDEEIDRAAREAVRNAMAAQDAYIAKAMARAQHLKLHEEE